MSPTSHTICFGRKSPDCLVPPDLFGVCRGFAETRRHKSISFAAYLPPHRVPVLLLGRFLLHRSYPSFLPLFLPLPFAARSKSLGRLEWCAGEGWIGGFWKMDDDMSPTLSGPLSIFLLFCFSWLSRDAEGCGGGGRVRRE